MSKKAHRELKKYRETFPEVFETMNAILEFRKSDAIETKYLMDCIPMFIPELEYELWRVYKKEKKRALARLSTN